MANATIGDDITTLYQFDWEDGPTRTSDEIGDLAEAGLSCNISDIVDVARDDPECEVTVIGFNQGA